MIAMAIMGLSLIYLFEAQARSLKLASKGRALNIATQLARKKLIDCKYDLIKKGFSIGDYGSDGTFEEEGYKDYKWECHGLRFNMPPPSPEAISKAMKAQSGGPQQPGGSGAMSGMDFGSNMLAPFFSLISTTFGDSIRELVLVVRWKEQGVDEDLKVVTHVVNTKPMTDLAGLLTAGAPKPPAPPPPPGPPK